MQLPNYKIDYRVPVIMIEDIITQKMPKYKIQARFLRIYPYSCIGAFVSLLPIVQTGREILLYGVIALRHTAERIKFMRRDDPVKLHGLQLSDGAFVCISVGDVFPVFPDPPQLQAISRQQCSGGQVEKPDRMVVMPGQIYRLYGGEQKRIVFQWAESRQCDRIGGADRSLREV